MARLILRYPNNVIKEVDFDQPRYRIGTAADNDLVLEGDGIAPHQAEIQTQDGAFTLTDVSEDKSTTVNGKNVEQTSITYGDRIAFGPIIGLFYPPQRKRKSGGGQPKLLMFMAAGGGAVIIVIILTLVLTTRSITNTVLQPPGEAFPITEAVEQTFDVTGTEGGREPLEGFEYEEPRGSYDDATRRDQRFIIFRLFRREELELPEREPE